MDTTGEKVSQASTGLPEELSIVYAEETQLHWRRIITAILVVVGLLTVIGWAGMNAISAERAAEVMSKDLLEEKDAEKSATAEVSDTAADTVPVDKLDDSLPELHEIHSIDAVDPDQPQGAVLSDVEALMAASGGDQVVESRTVPDVPQLPLELISLEETFLAPQPEPEDATQITRNPTFVSALQLTSALQDKNPTDLLDGEITLSGQHLIKVYAYSELTNLKGEQIFHEWYQNGKRMARVPVGVYLDNMRASTSKYIDQTMAGDWHLSITRANGEQLGRLDFRVEVDS